jgi:hypothetical protein
MTFSRVFEGSTFGNHTAPAGSKAAEIAISVSILASLQLHFQTIVLTGNMGQHSLKMIIS